MPLGAFSWGGPGSPALPRTRPDHLLFWVVSGRMRLQIARRTVDMAEDSVRFIPAGTAFAAHVLPETLGHVLTIPPELTVDVDPPLPPRMIEGRIGASAAALMVNLRELADEAARAADHRALTCHLNLLSLRLSRLRPDADVKPGPALPSADRPLVDRFLALAAVELGHCRSLAGLAQDLGTTLTVLDRACQQARGRRAVDLMHELQLERAAELLRHTDRAPARIAQDLGYASHAHLTRAFVTATGRTPETYRRQMQSKD